MNLTKMSAMSKFHSSNFKMILQVRYDVSEYTKCIHRLKNSTFIDKM